MCFVVSGGGAVEHRTISGGSVHRPPFRKLHNFVHITLPASFARCTKRRPVSGVYTMGSKGTHIWGECLVCRWWHWWYLSLTHGVLFPAGVGVASRSVLERCRGRQCTQYHWTLSVLCYMLQWRQLFLWNWATLTDHIITAFYVFV